MKERNLIMSMLNLTISNSMNRKTVIVNSAKTIRDIMTENGFEIGNAAVTIDGSTLRPGELDASLDTFGLNANVQHFVNSVIKADNAASALLTGGALVIASSATLDQLRLLEKYRPEAMKLYDESGKNLLFHVGTCEGYGFLGAYGAAFGQFEDNEGHATITLQIPEDVTEKESWVMDTYGHALLKLNQIEQSYALRIAEARAEQEAIVELITVC